MNEKLKKAEEKIRKAKEQKRRILEEEKKNKINKILLKTYGKDFLKLSETILNDDNRIEVFVNGEPLKID